jgi:hypothetical protein
MRTRNTAPLALLGSWLAASAYGQAPQTVRLHGTIEKVDGNTVMAKSDKGDELKINLADKTTVVDINKATLADIEDGDLIGSGAMPQPDGSQKAVEVHIFAESMRGAGEGFKPWDGAPNSTMTNGTVGGAAVTSVGGPIVTVKYKDGEKKIIIGPDVPIVRYEIGSIGDIKPGAAFAVAAANKQPDGSFKISRINIGVGGVVPR